MGKIYCVMGKSSSGKDSIYSRIMQQGNPVLLRIVPYTTRPRREGEMDGREYVFTDETHVQQLESAGKVIELRAYHTVYGIWKYFTLLTEEADLFSILEVIFVVKVLILENLLELILSGI